MFQKLYILLHDINYLLHLLYIFIFIVYSFVFPLRFHDIDRGFVHFCIYKCAFVCIFLSVLSFKLHAKGNKCRTAFKKKRKHYLVVVVSTGRIARPGRHTDAGAPRPGDHASLVDSPVVGVKAYQELMDGRGFPLWPGVFPVRAPASASGFHSPSCWSSPYR